MIRSNRYFKYVLVFCLLQQLALAFSTYSMAQAGAAFAQFSWGTMQHAIRWFFLCALIAYLLSACTEWFAVKLKNSAWLDYILNVFTQLDGQQRFSSVANQQSTTQWLTGEAPTVYDTACRLLINALSLYGHVILTLTVFGFTLGRDFTFIMLGSLLLSGGFVLAVKPYLARLGSQTQRAKLTALLHVNQLWMRCFYTHPQMVAESRTSMQSKSHDYFLCLEKATVLAQTLACFPTLITVLSLLLLLSHWGHVNDPISWGMLIAVLPRSLQLLGSVHAISLVNSEIPLVLKKLRNLHAFVASLPENNLKKNIGQFEITDVAAQKKINRNHFTEQLLARELQPGRYCITGANGSGKTSFLKWLKSLDPQVLLLSPEASLFGSEQGSSGEKKSQEIDFFLQHVQTFLCLDEWDANLDSTACAQIDQKIEHAARQFPIIEVRHRLSSSNTSQRID